MRGRHRHALTSFLLLVLGVGLLLAAAAGTAHGSPLAQAPTPGSGSGATAQADSLKADAEALYGKGEIAGALTELKQALVLYQQAGNLAGQVDTLTDFGDIYTNSGETAQALDSYTQALQFARQAGDQTREAESLDRIGVVYYSEGQYSTALDSLQQALGIEQQTGNHDDEGMTRDNIGLVYQKQGQYAQALSFYQQALSLAQAAGDQVQVARAENNIGTAYDTLGQYSQALQSYNQALTIVNQAENQVAGARILDNIGSVYYHEGQLDQALTNYQEALTIKLAGGDTAGVGASTNNASVVAAVQGNILAALGASDQVAQAQAQQLLQQSLTFGQQALDIARQDGDRDQQATALNNLGYAHEGLQQYPEALDAFQQSLALSQAVGDIAAEGITLGNIGDVQSRQGAAEDALTSYQQAIQDVEDVRASARLEELKSSLAAQSTSLYQRAALLDLQVGQPDQAFDLSERARARSFLDQLANTPLDLTRSADPQLAQQAQRLAAEISALDDQVRQQQSRPADKQDATLIQDLSQQLTAKQRQYTDTLTQLKLSDPETASLVSVQPLRFADVQALLDPNTTLLSYFITPEKTLAFLVTQSGFQEVDLPVRQADLEAAVADFRSFQDTSDSNPPQSLQQLYQWLIAPLASQLQTPVVGVIPDGILNYLPFAALSDGQQYFGDQHTLFELPDASSLPFIQAKRKGQDTSALVLAESPVAGFPTLQYVDQEAQNVAGLLGTQALTGSAATVTAVEQQGGSANVLHLAAHGDLNSASPLFSRILLAPDSQSDGSLTVQQVYSLNLAQADLVVLSACQTQLGGKNQGDDFVGLNRAFIYAGSPSVIASLWPVDDQATTVLMTSFYQHLTGGMSKAQALAAAQADTRAQFPNPYEWGAFVLSGDPGS